MVINREHEVWMAACILHDHEVLTTEEIRKIAERLYVGYELAMVNEIIEVLEMGGCYG